MPTFRLEIPCHLYCSVEADNEWHARARLTEYAEYLAEQGLPLSGLHQELAEAHLFVDGVNDLREAEIVDSSDDPENPV